MNDEVVSTPFEVKDDAEKKKKVRQALGEPEPLPVREALRKGKTQLKLSYKLLHFVQEINGLSGSDLYHAKGDLEDVKHYLTKIQAAVSRLESLLK